jgi:hypothetical protein
MYPPRILHRRYRLRNKKRLLGGIAIVALLVLGGILAIKMAMPKEPSYAADLPVSGNLDLPDTSSHSIDRTAASAMSYHAETKPTASFNEIMMSLLVKRACFT